MANYQVTYLIGETETIQADTIDPAQGQYIAYRDNTAVAYLPAVNVLSIVRQDAQR